MMCFRRSAQLPGRALVEKGLQLPSCCRTVKMQMTENLWSTFTTRSTLTEEVSEQVFSKERRRLQVKHLWMEVKLRWRCLLTVCTLKPPRGSLKKNSMLCFKNLLPGATTRTRMKKSISECCKKRSPSMVEAMQRLDGTIQRTKCSFCLRLQESFAGAIRKESRSSVGSECMYGALCKRWQTRKSTYQLKRRRLKPDVRDPPDDGSADVDIADIQTLDGVKDYYMVEENL